MQESSQEAAKETETALVTVSPKLSQWTSNDARTFQIGSAEDARDAIVRIGQADTIIARAGTSLRMAFGRVLLLVQQEEYWRKWGYDNWSEFIQNGVHAITEGHLGSRSAHEAMQWAKSNALNSIPEEERAEIPSVNARTLVRLEKADPTKAKDPDVIHKAKVLTGPEFRREVSASRGATTSRQWADDKEAARELDLLVEYFKGCGLSALQHWNKFLRCEAVTLRSGGGPDNAIDAIVSTCTQTWLQEQLEESQDEEGEPQQTTDQSEGEFTFGAFG